MPAYTGLEYDAPITTKSEPPAVNEARGIGASVNEAAIAPLMALPAETGAARCSAVSKPSVGACSETRVGTNLDRPCFR
jgi:hypothetical protein